MSTDETSTREVRAEAQSWYLVVLRNARNRPDLDIRRPHGDLLAMFKSLPGFKREVTDQYGETHGQDIYLEFRSSGYRDAAVAWINSWWGVEDERNG